VSASNIDIENYIDANAFGYIYINVGNFANNGVFDLIDDADIWSKLSMVQEKTGIDITKDLHGLLIVPLDSIVADNGNSNNMYGVLFSSLDYSALMKIVDFKKNDVNAKGGKFEALKNEAWEILVLTEEDGTKNCLHITNDGTMLYSRDLDTLRQAIKVYTNQVPNAKKSESFKDINSNIDNTSDLFGYFSMKELDKTGLEGNPFSQTLGSVNFIGFGISYKAKTIYADFKLFTDTDENAKKVADTFNGMKVMMAGIIAEESPIANDILNGVVIEGKNGFANINFTITEEQLKQLEEESQSKYSEPEPVLDDESEPDSEE
ncbi:MAG: hypothetical protein JW737_06855, partial [Acidobacteria bacterium]|nr:hypothetical protein [Acidobacteriota bacterium]